MALLSWLEASLINVMAAFIILLVGYVLSVLLSKFVKRILGELEADRILSKGGLKIRVERKLSKIVRWLVMIAAVIIALNQLGIVIPLLQIILVVVLILVIVSIIFSVRDWIPNFFYGFFIKIKKGEKVNICGVSGRVIKLSWSEALIESDKKDIIFIPYSILAKEKRKKV